MKKYLVMLSISVVFVISGYSNGADFDPVDLGACIYEDPTEQPVISYKEHNYEVTFEF